MRCGGEGGLAAADAYAVRAHLYLTNEQADILLAERLGAAAEQAGEVAAERLELCIGERAAREAAAALLDGDQPREVAAAQFQGGRSWRFKSSTRPPQEEGFLTA